jgi:hypothetical protein
MLKMSHRFLRNSPHFLKTMRDIQLMRKMGAKIRPEHQEFYKERQKETYDYGHPKLNTSKNEFFKAAESYNIFVHDDIHIAVKHLDKPAYDYYKVDGQEVNCAKDLFYSVSEEIRLFGALEEVTVLALERSQIPFKDSNIDPRRSWDIAHQKVCTSITSGWFRQYCYNTYDKIQSMYEPNYVEKFWKQVELGNVRKFGEI